MVEQGRHADSTSELIPDLRALAELQPRAQALASGRRGVEIPVVRGASQAAGHEEPLGEREQRAPGTAAPGDPDIAIVGLACGIDRDAEMRARCPEHPEEGWRGEQDLEVEVSTGFAGTAEAKHADIVG